MASVADRDGVGSINAGGIASILDSYKVCRSAPMTEEAHVHRKLFVLLVSIADLEFLLVVGSQNSCLFRIPLNFLLTPFTQPSRSCLLISFDECDFRDYVKEIM